MAVCCFIQNYLFFVTLELVCEYVNGCIAHIQCEYAVKTPLHICSQVVTIVDHSTLVFITLIILSNFGIEIRIMPRSQFTVLLILNYTHCDSAIDY